MAKPLYKIDIHHTELGYSYTITSTETGLIEHTGGSYSKHSVAVSAASRNYNRLMNNHKRQKQREKLRLAQNSRKEPTWRDW